MKNFLAKIAKQAVVLGSFFAISVAVAEMPSQPKPMWTDPLANVDGKTIAEDARRDPNTYCVNCHTANMEDFKHAGKHFQKDTVSPNNGKPLNCVSCHGNISEDHRKGVKDVMRFSSIADKDNPAKNPLLQRSVAEQNQVCFACHNPTKLRETFWAHDTHAAKITCTNCHKVHPDKEPMKGIEQKQRVKLCVDCHTNIHQQKSKQLEAAKEEK